LCEVSTMRIGKAYLLNFAFKRRDRGISSGPGLFLSTSGALARFAR
jgi:hypothetical protein